MDRCGPRTRSSHTRSPMSTGSPATARSRWQPDVITDTLALFVLALVAGSVESDHRPAAIVLDLALGLLALAAYCAVVLPRLARWAFAYVGEGRTPRFLI